MNPDNPDEVNAFIEHNSEGIARFMAAQNARPDATLLLIVSGHKEYERGLTFEFNPALFYQDNDALCRLLSDIKRGLESCIEDFSQEGDDR